VRVEQRTLRERWLIDHNKQAIGRPLTSQGRMARKTKLQSLNLIRAMVRHSRHGNGRREVLTCGWNSTFTHYLPAEAGCGFESCCVADFYSRAEEHAGENYKVGSTVLGRVLGHLK
jgi:hypothetical protein